jgi:hypothetical protein
LVHGDFEEMFLEEGVGMKALEGFQSICNKKIRRIQYSQVYPDLIVTDIKGNTGFSWKNTGYATLAACASGNTHVFLVLKSITDRYIPRPCLGRIICMKLPYLKSFHIKNTIFSSKYRYY